MDYDEMTDHIVKFEVGALYELKTWGSDRRWLTLYLGLAGPSSYKAGSHMFYIFAESRRIYISNSRAIRMAHSLHKLITKVETDVTATER